ncbi:MAG: lamin tail domain-containing protein [Pyrinomonadaceae bacterium]
MTARPRIVFFALAAALAICFVCLRSAETQSSLRRITNTSDEGISINPSISGDGRIIGFESTEDVGGAGGTNYFRAIRANISVDPPTFFQMGRTRADAPGISQDGSRIAFASKDDPLGTNADGNSEIFVFNGSNLVQVTNTTPGNPANRVTEGNFQPSMSDDGRFVAFSSNRNLTSQNGDGSLEVFVFDSVAAAFTQLTNSTGIVGFSDAKISGDGSAIACIRDPGATASTNRDLLRINRTNAAQTVLSLNVARLAMTYGRAISDDGARVAYSAETAANSTQVFYYDGRSGNVNRQVTTLGTRVTEVPLHPTISGDGRRIAFATRRALTGFSNSDASVELYTYDIPTGTFARITNVSDNDADCFDGSNAACEVVSSLNDDGSTVVFNFPRALSGTVTAGLENKSEIYATGLVARPPFGALTSILNQASLGHEPSPIKAVAPNSIAVTFGSVLANTTQQSQKQPNGEFPTNVGGTTVTVNGRAAQIFFVSPERVHFLVPPQTEIGNAEVVITNADGFASKGTVPILRAAPGIFTKTGDGIGEGMILDADTLAEGPFDPSGGNLRLLIFSTGVRNGITRTVNIGGRVVPPEAVNESTEMPGLDEVLVRVPADLRGAGNVNLFIQADGRDSNPVTVKFLGDPSRNVLINEVLADPPDGIAGDANHDGVRDGTHDEFVELVNGTSGEVISLGGWTIRTRATGSTTETTRFTFALGTSLPAGKAIVVFGGGSFNPSDTVFGCAQVVKATTTAGLSLTNSGVTVLIRDASGNLITELSYGGSTGLEGDNNQSLTRSPDITGTYVQHTAAAGANGRRYSPGLKTDGTPFGSCPSILTSVTISPPSATIDFGQTRQFTAQAFDQFGRAMTGVTITFSSDNTNVATVESVTMNSTTGVATATVKGQNPGVANITASATDGSSTVNSTPAVLTVNGPALSINDVTQNEGSSGTTTFTFTVSLSAPAPAGGASFDITTADGTATTANSDYLATGTTGKTISAGASSTTFDVTVNGDTQVEPNESFFVNISNASNATIGDGQGQGTIQNDDVALLAISQIYPGGGLTGATYRNDFVEVFNRGTTTVNFAVTPYSVQFLSTSGSTWAKTDLASGSLAPGGYFLVQETSGGANGSLLPTPDATGSLNLTSTTPGKVALVAGTTLLTGSCPGDDGSTPFNPVNGTVADFLGYGGTNATANHCYEGSGPAPFTSGSNTTADFREFGGCQDTNDNAADFATASPNPRNTSSPINDCTAADLEITKTDSPDPVNVGSNVTYTLTVTNHGPAAAQSVVVTDNLPANVTFVSCGLTGTGVCGGSGNNRTVTYTSIAAGGAETITLVATANGPAGTQISNTATVSSSTTDPNGANNSATATTDVNNPNFADLSITKSNSIDPVAPGNTLAYTVALTNNGPDLAQSVVVTDNLPSDVTFVDCSSNQGGVCGGPPTAPTISFASLANGATATITIRVTVSNALTTGAVITNTASVTAGSSDSNSGNDLDSETTTIQAVSAGEILISEFRFRGSNGANDEFIELYNPTTRTIDISGFKIFRSNNTGATSAHATINSGVLLPSGCHYLLANANASGPYNDAIPGDQTYSTGTTDDGGLAVTLASGSASSGILDQVGLSAGSAYKEGTPLASLGTTNDDRTYERKPGGAFGNGTDTNDNSADFLLNAPGSSNPQNSSSGCLNTGSADLSITKTDSPDPVTIGSNITYTITVLNNGAATAQNVSVTDSLPPEVTFVSCTPTGGASCSGVGNNRTVTLSSLASGASFTVTLVATANGPHGTIATNTATVSSTTPDANSSNDNAIATTLMQNPLPLLSIDDVTMNEGTGGTTNFVFTVTLTPASSQTVTVNYATSSLSPATAAAGTDYVSISGMLTFTPSDTTEQITVQVNGDSANEAICETFFVTLSSPVNATISDDTGQGGITDDDGTKLVISQIYGGGGNSGASYTHDFVELFNRGDTPISLNGLSLQYAPATGTTGNYTVTTLPNVTLQPGRYYLIQGASASGTGSPLPTPDLIPGTLTDMAATAGRVALVNGTGALSRATCPTGATIIDFVGYGTSAICREGATTADNAAAPSNTTSAQRKLGGCQDTGNNNADFTSPALAPNPRNTSSAANTCSCSTSYSSFFSFGDDWLKGSLAKLTVTEPSLRLVPQTVGRSQLLARSAASAFRL